MKHISDGDLHAYLDGALELYPREEAERIRRHLDTCEACRERLRDEEGVRDVAKAVLDAGAPGAVVPPPFEELRRRAESPAPQVEPGTGTPARLRMLAWAASVILALGLGWSVGRGPLAGPGDPGGVAGVDEMMSPGGAEPGGTPGALDAGSRVAVEEDEEVGRALAEAVVRSDALEPTEGVRVAALPEDPPPSEPTPVGVASELRAEDAQRRTPPATVPPSPEPSVSPPVGELARLAPELLRARAAESRALSSPDEEITALAIPDSLVGTHPDSTRRGRERQVSALLQRVPGGGLVMPDLGLRPDAGRRDERTMAPPDAMDTSAAGAVSEAPVAPLQIPGLEVVQLDFAEVAPGIGSVRVVQRIPGDTVNVEVFFGGLGVVPDEASGRVPDIILESALPEGVHQVAQGLERGWVVLRGRIPEEGLRSLLRLLR